MTAEPTRSTVKMLFALSGNVCAMPQCEMVLFRPGWGGVRAEIAHIAGEKPTAARFNESMTDDERRHFDNLIVLCPNCHTLIDTLERDAYPVDRLQKIKAQHEERMGTTETQWASESQLSQYVVLAFVQYGWSNADEEADGPIPRRTNIEVNVPPATASVGGAPVTVDVGTGGDPAPMPGQATDALHLEDEVSSGLRRATATDSLHLEDRATAGLIQDLRVSIAQNPDGSIEIMNNGPGKIDRVRTSIINGNNRLLKLQEVQGFPIEEGRSMTVAHEITEAEFGGPITPEVVGMSVVWQDSTGVERSTYAEFTVPGQRP